MAGPKSVRVPGVAATRLAFLMAAALIAAALADPIVETIANTGMLGGQYADTNHVGIIPTLVVGGVLVLELLVFYFVETWRSLDAARGHGGDLLDIAKGLAAGSFRRDFPSVLAMQLTALFVMESTEQLALGGKLLGGTAWLGGPIPFSLIVHAFVGACCILVLGAFMRAVVRIFTSIVRTAIAFIWLAITHAARAVTRFADRELICLRAQSPHARQIGGRAPPLLSKTAHGFIS